MDAIATGGVTPGSELRSEHAFEFRGDWRQYFRIWIVNLALTLLTLGIFSAWASVRSRRWFYGNTWVAGAPFEYLAQPLQILKGRAIAVVLLVTYLLAEQLVPFLAPVLLFLLALGTPWLVVAGLRFRARYSAWRTLNFRFEGTVSDSVWWYLLAYIALLPTLGLVYPYIRRHQQAYVVGGHRFGGHDFSFGATTGQFYRIYAKAALVWVAAGVSAGGLFAGLAAILAGRFPEQGGGQIGFALAGVGAVYLSILPAAVYISSRVTNLTYGGMTLGPHGFRSTLRFRRLLGLYFGNTLAVLLSLGLLIPWAQVRMVRYRVTCMTLLAADDLQAFSGRGGVAQGATGGEAAEAFDVDISL